ncbi:MAG: double-strand break repair protein AddB, partial [Phenylobacterium zucineum]
MNRLSTGSGWYTIPSHRPFVLDLAKGLYDLLSPQGPQALSQAVVLTPTRRGARALADAFVTITGGRALLPPQIRPLGDLDEGEAPFEPGDLALDLPAAIGGLRRRFELLGLVKHHEATLGRTLDAPSALEFADALGSFLDSLQIEEVSAGAGLADLVTADMAEHWRMSREFLEMALEAWPRRLAELGLMDISARRVALLRALAEKWDQDPPKGVLVAAGSTGTAKATAALLRVIARAPQGAVVLPGLDHNLSEKAWAGVGEQHPQGAMKRLLTETGLRRAGVLNWHGSSADIGLGHWRRRVINEALRPAEDTADWLTAIGDMRDQTRAGGVDPIAEGLKGLSLISARTEDEAATAAALLLREALETPGRTAALVSPDQVLARRVSAKLLRWGVVADSSAGLSLAGCPIGVLADLVVQSLIDPLDPVRLLAILKHPLVRLDVADSAPGTALESLERYGLRGPRAADWARLTSRLTTQMAKVRLDPTAAIKLLERLNTALPDVSGEAQTAADLARCTVMALEALAQDQDGSPTHLWAGLGGEALSRLLAGLIEDSNPLPMVTARSFVELFRKLVAGETVRAGGASHPRLRLLGAIEARLIRADLLIVAGLEEGVWPQGAPVDPFLSRPMRQTLGLPPPERRIGLAAHDFAQAACAPDVVLLHTERRAGAPSIKSRWLWRLETLARGAGLKIAGHPEVLALARSL